MQFSTSALGRRVLAITLLAVSACGEKSSASTPAAPDDGLTETQRDRLRAEPLSELAFVPEDIEGLVRLDLGSLAERDPQTAQALVFVLKAQQPAASEVLESAGLRVGRELRAIYFLVGAKKDHFLVAGVGHFEPNALAEELGRRGERGEQRHGATVFHWEDPEVGRFGATDLGSPPPLGPTSLAVATNLLVVGTPALVEAALEARAQKRKDIRTRKAVVQDLLALDVSAAVWGVGHASSAESFLPGMVAGVERARFHGALVDRGTGTVQLEAHFSSAKDATAFGKQLGDLLRTGAALAPASTPIGKTLSRMKANAKIAVEDRIVRASVSL
jgi:hypothetical protein